MPSEYPKPPYTDAQLRYAAYARCSCGAGLAYAPNATPRADAWFCSAMLKDPCEEQESHDAGRPFAFWEIKSEIQPSANGATTRPAGAPAYAPPPRGLRFRKKPVVITAMQFDGSEASRAAIFEAFGLDVSTDEAGCISIQTIEGVMKASPGDWIIRGVQGEFYPCKPAVFAMTYEPVE